MIFGANGAFSDSLFAEEKGRIRTYLAAYSELFYITKHSLIRVVSDVKLVSYQLAVYSAIICSRSEKLRGLALDSALDFSPRELPRETVKQLKCRQGTTRGALNSSLIFITRRG